MEKSACRILIVLALLLALSLTVVLIKQAALPRGGQMTYSKYGCILNDPSKRDRGQYLGLSICQ